MLVPGQVISHEILDYLKALDVKEIHGYNAEFGLRVFQADEVAHRKARKSNHTPSRLREAEETAHEKLKGISDIRRFFYRNDGPDLLHQRDQLQPAGHGRVGPQLQVHQLHRLLRRRSTPTCSCRSEKTDRVFQSIEEINNYLLAHEEFAELVKRNARRGKSHRGNAVFLFFDERPRSCARSWVSSSASRRRKLREEIDDKIETTRIGDEAGVPSVPNTLARWTATRRFAKLARPRRGLGDDLVVQTAFGDSGHTTFFISNEEDYAKHAEEIEREKEVKVMKRVRCRGAALEACVTRHGTIVGPLMTELVGFKELTPYRGGWCGNEVFADAFSPEVRDQARKYTFQFGEALRKRGYRGYFEVDYLYDLDTDELYLGEVNPRITGASSMTNLASFAHADAPLFLFHLLEFSDVDFELDVEELNARWSDPDNIDSWSQLVIKHTRDSVEFITDAPRTGIWKLHPDGGMQFRRVQTHRRTVEDEYEAFFLRINGVGDYFYEGADLGILVTPGRLMTEDFQLTDRAKKWISGIRGQYRSRPLQSAETAAAERVAEVGGFKFL